MITIITPFIITLVVGVLLGIAISKIIPFKTKLSLKISVILIALISFVAGVFSFMSGNILGKPSSTEVRLKKDIDIVEDYYFNPKNYPPEEWSDVVPKIDNPPYEPKAQGLLKKGSILKRQNVKSPCAYLDLTIAVKKTDIEDVK
ncbi:MAG: hypothetical protein ABH865_09705 [Candidatus Omnitrophota bacterium]